MKKETKNWLKHAESDYHDAKLLWENHRAEPLVKSAERVYLWVKNKFKEI